MKVKKFIVGLIIVFTAILMPVTKVHAQQDGALLDALVKKGVLSDQEREDIIASEEKDYSQTAASKISLGSSIKTIQFYGDLRLRYEMRDGTVDKGDVSGAGTVFGHNDSQTRSRWRYRLRLGVKGELYDNFFYGIRAATNPYYDRSGNVTFGDSDSGGPFGKGKSLLSIDQVFLGWKPTNYLTLTGGKMPNPLYTTNMVWDDNLNPEGAAEQFNHTFGDTEVFATAGQFVYGDSADNAAFTSGGSNFDDIFMFAEEVGFKYNFDEHTAFKAAASLYTYSGSVNGSSTSVAGLYSSNPLNLNNASSTSAENNSPALFNGPYVGAASAPATNISGINALAVLETPMEFDFKAWGVPMRVFGDFAYNLEADSRSDDARNAIAFAEANDFAGSKFTGNSGLTVFNTNPTTTGMTSGDVAKNKAMFAAQTYQGILNSGQGFLDQSAYQLGYEAGQLKKKGDWDTKVFWQSTGYYAVDPNLIDADIFNAAPNMQGVVVAVAYNWTDGLTSTLRYAAATRVNDKLSTPNVNQDLQTSTIHEYNLFQADLLWKF